MRLVHQAEDDLWLGAVLFRQLFPNVGELSVGRSTLADDPSVPTSIVVEVEDGVGALAQGVLDQLVIGSEPGSAQGSTELSTDGGVPAEGESEDVGAALDKVVDLRGSRVGGGHRVDIVACDRGVGCQSPTSSGVVL